MANDLRSNTGQKTFFSSPLERCCRKILGLRNLMKLTRQSKRLGGLGDKFPDVTE